VKKVVQKSWVQKRCPKKVVDKRNDWMENSRPQARSSTIISDCRNLVGGAVAQAAKIEILIKTECR
jgi:hypothetical protein